MRAATALAALACALDGAAQEPLLAVEAEPAAGAVHLTLDALPADFLYVTALQTGLGSNDVGLDRGQLDRTRWVRFERYGNRVLLVEPNLGFRADSEDPAERASVAEAFAVSVLAGFDVVKATDAGAVIDIAPLLLSDATRVADRLQQLEQGDFSLDAQRSAVDFDGIRAYPDNVLLPAVLTFAGKRPGPWVRDVAPTPDAVSLRVVHQFVRLPDDGYAPRAFHPRSGYFDLAYRDYAAPLEAPVEKRLIYRHDLADETLVYHVDPGAPEPIRSALIEGASWWAEAFEAAGHPGAFRVDVLPEGVDPLDVRYNVIQWVHRATRGWSYGASVADPRTGEILKGHVSLGSLRVRQDQLIAEALTAPFVAGDEAGAAAREMALARIRQLSAHEVGHTLGLDHNFGASSVGDGSVMDYPHPNLRLDEAGRVRLDDAYRTGVSAWDRLAIRYGYTRFEPGAEAGGLAAILAEADERGLVFLNGADGRQPGSAHPAAHLWDNGQDTLARLDELLRIREVGLAGFSPAVLRAGVPLSEMERRLVPVWLLHRYQVEAVGKLLGGLRYDHRLRGDAPTPLAPVDGPTQQRALDALLALLDARRLTLPGNIRHLIPPPAAGYPRDREAFSGAAGEPFDHLAPARAATRIVVDELLRPNRLARIEDQHALDQGIPSVETLLQGLVGATWMAPCCEDPAQAAARRASDWVVLETLLRLDADPDLPGEVRELLYAVLLDLSAQLERATQRGDAHAAAGLRAIREALEEGRPPPGPPAGVRVPPGSPIG